MTDILPHLPGRLGNPDATLDTDGRTDPRIAAAVQAMGGDFAPGIEPISPDATYEECLAYCAAFEEVSAMAHPLMLDAMPEFPTVESWTETINGVDGNEIRLFIHRPKDAPAEAPCIVHTHGGGMVIMTAEDPMFIRLRNSLAAAGAAVVGVEFRNGGGRLGNHPFPAGLNDCASAVQWTHANRARLGISSIVISGESGGGNLCIATTLKAKQEGWVDQIDGVYAMCPYIYGGYANPDPALLSLVENDGYMLECSSMAPMAKVYDPNGENATNPLAWPYHAQPSDLEGLPRHVISVNELDPLRDEGLAFYRKLAAAGVPVTARTIHGTPHAGDQGFPDIAPELYAELIRLMVDFAGSV
jgi:acetyl esterase/lipase